MRYSFGSMWSLLLTVVLVTGCSGLDLMWIEKTHLREKDSSDGMLLQHDTLLRPGERSIQYVRGLGVEMARADMLFMPGVILQNFADDQPRKLLRNFGPFFTGSDLTEIRILLNHDDADWYYGDFLMIHEDTEIFKKYYGTPLPSGEPGTNIVPGSFPSKDGFNDVLLELQRISYSSRYGGSIRLRFKSRENYEIEIRKGPMLWDLSTLTMDVFVEPQADFFNPDLPLGPGAGTAYIELLPRGVSAYRVEGGILAADAPGLDDLKAMLGDLASRMATAPFQWEATKFVHGFIHSLFKADIGAMDKVEIVEISDGFLDLHTRDGVLKFAMEMRAFNVFLDTEPGDEEINITLNVQHIFDPNDNTNNPVIAHEFDEINNMEGTPFWTFGFFDLEECGTLHDVIFIIQVVERDGVADDRLQTEPSAFSNTIDCGQLRAWAEEGRRGVVSESLTQGVPLLDGEETKGMISFATRMSILLR